MLQKWHRHKIYFFHFLVICSFETWWANRRHLLIEEDWATFPFCFTTDESTSKPRTKGPWELPDTNSAQELPWSAWWVLLSKGIRFKNQSDQKSGLTKSRQAGWKSSAWPNLLSAQAACSLFALQQSDKRHRFWSLIKASPTYYKHCLAHWLNSYKQPSVNYIF